MYREGGCNETRLSLRMCRYKECIESKNKILKKQVHIHTGWGLCSGMANRGCSEAVFEVMTKKIYFY